MKNASHADGKSPFPRLFDLRDTERTLEGSDGDAPLANLADTRLIVHPEADPVFVEQYRRLGAVLHQAQLQHGIRSIMVASAVAAEGKTSSATNVALTLSHSFKKRVLLVDGDLRKPTLHRLFQIENGNGLSDVLDRLVDRLPIHILSPTLSLITSGHTDGDPVGLLVSEAARKFWAQMREAFDWVVVDTPPAVLFPDAALFADGLDKCVMVVSAATTSSAVAAKAVAAIGVARILGVVLNRADPTDLTAGYGYGPYKYLPNSWSRSSR